MNKLFFTMLTAVLMQLTLQEFATAQQPLDYNRDIRPILAENCFYCHGQDPNKRQGELRLDDREAAIDAGAIVPDNSAGSSLVQRIHSEDAD